MSVSIRNWQAETGSTVYRSVSSKEPKDEKDSLAALLEGETEKTESIFDTFAQSSENSGNNYKVKSSSPDDSVGQLAAMLARAETRIDVQQVSSRAIRALTNLKMSAAACSEEDAKKIARQIRRMEKLIKRIKKKLQHLSKEEQIENRKKLAEKKNNMPKVEELEKDLRARRNKRRRDERNYATKEMAEDGKNAAAEVTASVAGAGTAVPAPDLTSFIGGGTAANVPAAESVSIDVTV